MQPAVVDQLPAQNLKGTRVLVRIDSSDDAQACLPTLEYFAATGSRIVVAADFVDHGDIRLAEKLRRMLGRPVRNLSASVGNDVLRTVLASGPQEIVLLPDLGSYPEEMANDPNLSCHLASLAEIYCNDAFPLAHLALASTVGIVRFVRTVVAGFAMARNVARIESVVNELTPPSLAIIGGTNLEKKAALLWRLCDRVDHLFIGGSLCFPFLRAKGFEIGGAPIDENLVPIAREILSRAGSHTEIVLPTDFLTVSRTSASPERTEVTALLSSHVPMDIGTQTLRRIEALLIGANTVLWNGSLGFWEIESFAAGTREVARAVEVRAAKGLRIVIWGDSLASALRQFEEASGPLSGMITSSPPTTRLVSGLPLPGWEALKKDSEPRARKVILPVDGSKVSLEFLRRAGPVLEATGSEIYLLVVTSPSRGDRDADKLRLQVDRIFDCCNSLLAQFRTHASAQIVMEGDTAECVLKYAKEVRPDLIAIPSRAIPAPIRRIAGDWSRIIERRATFPLLMVPVSND